MPTYEYACKSCGAHQEVVQSFTDDALTECPACGGQLRKVFGSIGISFKGSGFYKTDSRPGSTSATTTTKSDTSGTDAGSTTSGGSDGGGGSSDKAGAPAASTPAATTTTKPAKPAKTA